MSPEDSRLEILHDHYKESFSHIRERERQRDRLFLVLIVVLGLLFLEVRYPESFRLIFSEISASGAKLNLSALPVPAVISSTWTFYLAIIIHYCQVSIHVERQYPYLHRLEEKISALLEDPEVYCREGKAYLDNYPAFSTWAWIFYIGMFPVIVIVATGLLVYTEVCKLELPLYHKWYDGIVALAVVFSVGLYRIWPLIISLLKRVGLYKNKAGKSNEFLF